jgi:hypothetical protein
MTRLYFSSVWLCSAAFTKRTSLTFNFHNNGQGGYGMDCVAISIDGFVIGGSIHGIDGDTPYHTTMELARSVA